MIVRLIKAARCLLEWSQEELSRRSGVPLSTIARIEAAGDTAKPREKTSAAIFDAFKRHGVTFAFTHAACAVVFDSEGYFSSTIAVAAAEIVQTDIEDRFGPADDDDAA